MIVEDVDLVFFLLAQEEQERFPENYPECRENISLCVFFPSEQIWLNNVNLCVALIIM